MPTGAVTAGAGPAAAPLPLPAGFGIAVDAGTRQLDPATLFGGSPGRVIRLSRVGLGAWAQLRADPVGSAAAGLLARRLTDAGLAHPRPPEARSPADATVVIPVRDRPQLLARCLTALGGGHPVIVVDDGSRQASAVAEIAAEHGAMLLRRPASGGPAAARNTGLARVGSDIVVFLDSDCVPPDGWIARLAGHLADPLVAAVAPRIVALPSTAPAGRYCAAASSLDLGGREARVMPGSRVSYVPTAALVLRRSALHDLGVRGSIYDHRTPGSAVADAAQVLDPALRYGEDVDLIWRLHEAGWRIRYDPAVQVGHQEPATWPALLSRRFRYGTSAAPLARRHPAAIPPLVLHPWPALTVAGLLARRPAVACACFAASVLTTARILRRAGLPAAGVTRAMLTGVHQTWLGAGRYGTQFAAPLLARELSRRSWGRRAAAASLLLGPPVTTWAAGRPALDPVRFTLARLAEDMAYGAGVYSGCARARTLRPVRPAVSWRPLRVTGSAGPRD